MGYAPQDAEDLTQAFFTELLETNIFTEADREKGKFRTFLLTALKRFMTHEKEYRQAIKRGGGQTIVSIDQAAAEKQLDLPAARQMEPDVYFERQWALTLLAKVMERLQQEYAVSGRARLFEALKDCLAGDISARPYAEIAAQLHLTEPAVKMAVSRIRALYREILRAEIADTLENPAEVDEEIRHLFAIFE
jgi:RNA polymerase sigma-70 factor (ECF subfamily)